MRIAKIIFTPETIAERVKELGQEITADYQGKKLVLTGILNGAFIFLADLARAVELEVEIDFIRAASYGNSSESSGSVTLRKGPDIDVAGKHVLLVEDIVDSGITVAWLRQYFAARHQAASVKLCALIDKQERRTESVQVDYVGFRVDSGFLVGYGLDYAQQYRNRADVCALEPD
jgi:hypoxanthine phosphoribosyltransferase